MFSGGIEREWWHEMGKIYEVFTNIHFAEYLGAVSYQQQIEI